jgi:acyl-CoA synthetase (AMP-forming)/AMP-acid ligase II
VITEWIESPRAGHGIYLAEDAGGWTFHDYPALAASARHVGAGLRKAGVKSGGVVCVIMPTSYEGLAALFGTWVAGGTLCTIAEPSLQSPAEYAANLAVLLKEAEPAVVVTTSAYGDVVRQGMAAAGRDDAPWRYAEDADDLAPQPTGEIAVLQFTSGSTGSPRAACVSWANLAANLKVITRVLGWRDDDGIASWLPLYHDLGLLGCLLTVVAMQGDGWLMRPEQFLRDPARWLEALGTGKATHTGAPAFAYGYVTRRVKPDELAGVDLSGVRTALAGAEAVDAAVLEAFVRFAEPLGFRRQALLPAYGLAEASVAVSGARRDRPIRLVRIDPLELRFGGQVSIAEAAELGGGQQLAAGWLLSHGRPEPSDGVIVTIVGEDGAALPDEHLGEIAVAGPSVTTGYFRGRTGGATSFVDGQLRTGDAGFIHDGDIYVVGRMGNSLKIRGRSVYMEDLDAAVATAAGLGRGRLTVVGSQEGGRPRVVLFAEAPPGDWAEKARRALRSRVGAGCPVTIVSGRAGLVQRTSSGKPQRRRMWEILQSGLPDGAQIIEERADAGGG